MKVITVWQPYASLLVWGEKRYETRGWQPFKHQLKQGEIILIHAAVRKPTVYEHRIFMSAVFDDIFVRQQILTLNDLPYGAIIAAARFVCAHPTEAIRNELSVKERALGNYQDGRFAWELEVVKVPDAPIPAKGQQGLWTWEGAM